MKQKTYATTWVTCDTTKKNEHHSKMYVSFVVNCRVNPDSWFFTVVLWQKQLEPCRIDTQRKRCIACQIDKNTYYFSQTQLVRKKNPRCITCISKEEYAAWEKDGLRLCMSCVTLKNNCYFSPKQLEMKTNSRCKTCINKETDDQRQCIECGISKKTSDFSETQVKRKKSPRCRTCVAYANQRVCMNRN